MLREDLPAQRRLSCSTCIATSRWHAAACVAPTAPLPEPEHVQTWLLDLLTRWLPTRCWISTLHELGSQLPAKSRENFANQSSNHPGTLLKRVAASRPDSEGMQLVPPWGDPSSCPRQKSRFPSSVPRPDCSGILSMTCPLSSCTKVCSTPSE